MRITKENLTRYDQHFKSWQRRRLGCANALENWHQTEEAGAVTCWPVGGTPLEGKVKFSFKETPPASGDKGPDNPSVISGVSSVKVTRCGKNLLLAVPDDTSWYGISITRQSDGSYLLNGTSTSGQDRFFPLTDCGNLSSGPYATLKLNTAKTYTLFATVVSGTITGGASVSAMNSRNTGWIPGRAMSIAGGGTAIATISASSLVTGEFVCRLNVGSGTSFNNVVLQVQLEEGDTATDFEAPMLPADANHTLSLGSTYYGGEIDLATGLMTVTHVIRTVDGTNIKFVDGGETTNYYRLYFPIVYSQPAADRVLDTKCTFIDTAYFGFNTDSEHYYVGTDRVYVFLDKTLPFLSSSGTVVEKANAYATQMVQGGTPWSVTYKLATPYTVQLDPLTLAALAQTSRHEPRLNTVYTDADSIQITYRKSPIRAATEQEMAILGLGGNV